MSLKKNINCRVCLVINQQWFIISVLLCILSFISLFGFVISVLLSVLCLFILRFLSSSSFSPTHLTSCPVSCVLLRFAICMCYLCLQWLWSNVGAQWGLIVVPNWFLVRPYSLSMSFKCYAFTWLIYNPSFPSTHLSSHTTFLPNIFHFLSLPPSVPRFSVEKNKVFGCGTCKKGSAGGGEEEGRGGCW